MNITNGVITDRHIFDVPLVVQLVAPQGNTNVRTGIPLEDCLGVTIHNTGNANQSADAMAHAKWLQSVENSDADFIGAHFFVDAVQIVQVLPLNEVAWHAGDGYGAGNMRSIAIEICEIEPYTVAERNAEKLAAALLKVHDH